jgi:hypothetical protein
LPGPVWLFYLVLLVVLVVVVNSLAGLMVCRLSAHSISIVIDPFYPVCVLALIHY